DFGFEMQDSSNFKLSDRLNCVVTQVCYCPYLRKRILALDRFSVFQFERENPAPAGVVVRVALPGGQALEIRLDEPHLLEPVDGTRGKSEDADHPDPRRLLNQVRYDLSAHAQVAVYRVRGDCGDLSLAVAVVVKCSASVDHIVDRVDDEVTMPRHQVVFGPVNEDAFLH